jgi:hypothetical protein
VEEKKRGGRPFFNNKQHIKLQHDRGLFHFRRAAFSPQLKEKVGSTLAKAAAYQLTHHTWKHLVY